MTAHEPVASRGSRSRILLVGRSDAASRIHDVQPEVMQTATDLFDAIGVVAASPASQPICAVIVPAQRVRELGEAPLAALRRVDPSLQIILLADDAAPGDGVHPDLTRCVDGVLFAPVTADDLQRLLQGEALPARHTLVEAHAPMPHAASSAPSASTVAAEQVVDNPAAEAPGTAASAPMSEAPPDVDGHDAEADDQAPARHAPATRADGTDAGESLGDTDLVRAVRCGESDQLLRMALAILRQQTGWTDLAFIAPPPAGRRPRDDEAVVAHDGRAFGALRSAMADREQMAPWAQWLAEWLALDADRRRLHEFAYRDYLTGAYNRRYFEAFLADKIAEARARRQMMTVMVFDIDDFKRYNDRYGHAAGDTVLCETVRLLQSVIRADDCVCRIGGDEFAVIFWEPEGPRTPGSQPPQDVATVARRFQDQVCRMKFPKLGPEAPGSLSISGGLATYPWDGATPEDLLRHADELALQSKRKGKNVLTFGPGAKRHCGGEHHAD